MRIFWIVLLMLSAKAWAAPCTLPGLIESFPMSVTTTGECHPGTYHLSPEGPLVLPACGLCGSAAELPSADPDNPVIRALVASPSLVTAMRASSFTIQFNMAVEWSDPGHLPGVPAFPFGGAFVRGLTKITGTDGLDSYPPYHQFNAFSTGELAWAIFYSPTVVIRADARIQVGRCYQITLIKNGVLYYILLDGELIGGPVTINRPAVPLPVLEALSFGTGYCCSDAKFHFSQLLFADTAIFPDAGSVLPEVCPGAAPTPTPPPPPTLTLVPTETPAASPEPMATASPSFTSTLFTATATRQPTLTPTLSPAPTAMPRPGVCRIDCSVPITRVSQGDSKWGDVEMDGSGETISESGCLLTCLAMIAGKNPDEANTTLNSGGAISKVARLDFELSCDLLKLEITRKSAAYNEEKIDESLCLGEYVIAEVRRKKEDGSLSPHFVVVSGKDITVPDGQSLPGCRYLIADPGNRHNLHLDVFPDRKGFRSIRRKAQ